DRLLTRLEPFLGWLFAAPGFLLWLGLILYTVVQFAPEWSRFVSASGQVIAPDNWIRIIFIYAVLKVINEFGHGLATKRYNGPVPEWGVQLLAFITPLAFVDASASWKFSSKWKRIIVAAAGMYVEVAIACLCLLGWMHTSPGVLNTSLHSAVIAATFVTLLFNANPLMRFDGYYILLDSLGIPNLGTKGQNFLKWFGKRYVLGMKDLTMPPAARQHPIAVPLYGVLAALWKIIIWIGIMILVSLLFKGAGLVLALASLIYLLVSSLVKFLSFLFKVGTGPKLSDALPRLGILCLVIFALFSFVRINPTGRAVAVVEYADRESIRAGVRGLVVDVPVEEGASVEAGEILMELTNPDEEAEAAKLVLELGQSKIRARSYYQSDNLPAYQAEIETIRGLEQKIFESEQYLAALQVIAPASGTVAGRRLDSMPGQWVEVGDELLSVIPDNRKELLISFRQEDIEDVADQEDREIRIRLRGRSRELTGKINRIESRATRALPHEVLAAPNGGALALRTSSDPLSEREREIASGNSGYDTELDYFTGAEGGGQGRELARARFVGRASIEEGPGDELLEGEWGYVRFAHAEKERLGRWLYDEVSTYVREKIEEARAAATL
ncbi:MAG: HlyD family efflux transporter periplasmic adaptor subunit, partial [Verrucomicrobiota bacterium]